VDNNTTVQRILLEALSAWGMRQNPGSAGMKVIALTYAGQRGDALRCKQLGIAGYLLKPIIHSDLLECISEVLSQNEGSTSLVTRHSLREARRIPDGLEIQKDVPRITIRR
jgi:two-component system sensor histidine kinase/response regulator